MWLELSDRVQCVSPGKIAFFFVVLIRLLPPSFFATLLKFCVTRGGSFPRLLLETKREKERERERTGLRWRKRKKS